MEVLCYGCGRGEYPENTIEAISHCQNVNPNWIIDLDLQLTKDNEVIVFHDYNLERRTGIDAMVFDLDLQAISKLNAAYNFKKNNGFSYRDNPLQIPTLETIFSQFSNARFILDLHSDNPKLITKTIEIITHYKISDFLIVSHYDKVITSFKALKPNWNYGAASQAAKKLVFSSYLHLDNFFSLREDVLLIPIKYLNFKLLTKRVLRHIQKRNKKCYVWLYEGKTNDSFQAVHTREEYDWLKSLGVSGVYTEYPQLLTKLLEDN